MAGNQNQKIRLNSSISGNPIRVLIVQQINRAYRVPLLIRLSEHPEIDLTMIYGTSSPVQGWGHWN